MIATSDLVIPREFLESAKMSGQEMLIDLATHLYATKKLSIGLAGLDLSRFRKSLRNAIYVLNYDIDDLHEDMRNLGIALRRK